MNLGGSGGIAARCKLGRGTRARLELAVRFNRLLAYTKEVPRPVESQHAGAALRELMRMTGPLALAFLAAVGAAAATPPHFDSEAVRANNRGVAEMSQQSTERAAATFAEAFKKDPKLAQAAINEGIALLYLQKASEAEKACRRRWPWSRAARRGGTTWGWRNTRGLNWKRAGQFSAGHPGRSADADSYYFAACASRI